MERCERIVVVVQGVMLGVLVAVGLASLVIIAAVFDWKLVAAVLLVPIMLGALIKAVCLLWTQLFKASTRRLKRLKRALAETDEFNEETLLMILDLSREDLELMCDSNALPVRELLHYLRFYRELLVKELSTSKSMLDEASTKSGDLSALDIESSGFSGDVWLRYLETKCNYEQSLLSQLGLKERQIVRECTFRHRYTTFEAVTDSGFAPADNCAICLSAFASYQTLVSLGCRHYFHANCLEEWVLEKPACPLCKQSL